MDLKELGDIKFVKTIFIQSVFSKSIFFLHKKRQVRKNPPAPFCRDEAIRTPDPYVPNVVRYQLRYIPIALKRMQI